MQLGEWASLRGREGVGEEKKGKGREDRKGRKGRERERSRGRMRGQRIKKLSLSS